MLVGSRAGVFMPTTFPSASRPNSRRNFLQTALGVTAGLGPVCSLPPLVQLGLSTSSCSGSEAHLVACGNQEFRARRDHHLTVFRRAWSPASLPPARWPEKYAGRIHDIDKRGPAVNASSNSIPDALASPRRSTESASQGPARATSRHSGPHQRQHRYGGQNDDHGGIAGAAGLAAGE